MSNLFDPGHVPLTGLPIPGLITEGDALNALLLSLSPTLYARFNENAGNLINYGSDGNSGTVVGPTQGQTGQLGTNEAYLFDGVDDIITLANADIPATKALTSQRWMFLINASSLGENSNGMFAVYGAANQGFRLFLQVGDGLRATVDAATDADAITNAGQVDFLNTWALVFVDYDHADDLGLGRKNRILRATAASATTLLTLGTDQAAVGALVTVTNDLHLGNRAATDRTFAGLMDIVFAGTNLWSPAGSPADLTLPDQIRSLVFGV